MQASAPESVRPRDATPHARHMMDGMPKAHERRAPVSGLVGDSGPAKAAHREAAAERRLEKALAGLGLTRKGVERFAQRGA